MDDSNSITTLTPTVMGNQYSFDDGTGGTAQFLVGLDGGTVSTSGNANAGTFNLAMNNLVTTGDSFSGDINLFGTHTIHRADLVVGTGGVSKTYDGTATLRDLILNLDGVVAGDAVNISGQGHYADRNVGTGLSYSVTHFALSGSDANNYALPSGTVLNDTDGIILAKDVTLSAPAATKVYDGNSDFDVTATQLSNLTNALGIAGDTVDGITLAFDDKNVGTNKTLTPSSVVINDGNGGGNYNVTLESDATGTISRLGSVTWIGGSTGDWNDASNWAGNAIPDLANVAHVIIPSSVTPTFGISDSGPVKLDSLTGGGLQFDGGTLDVVGNFAADSFTQNSGSFTSGDFTVSDFTQNDGIVRVDNDFTVTNLFAQSDTGIIEVGGVTRITQSVGDLVLGDLSTTDGLTVNVLTGGLRQFRSGRISSFGLSRLFARNRIILPSAANYFGDTVTVDSPLFFINATPPPQIVPVGSSLDRSWLVEMNGDLVRDTKDRPRETVKRTSSWINRSVQFLTGLLKSPGTDAPHALHHDVTATQQEQETYIRQRVK